MNHIRLTLPLSRNSKPFLLCNIVLGYTLVILCIMILLLLLCAVPTRQDDKDLPAVVSSWLPTTTVLTFTITNTTTSAGIDNQTYTIKPTLGTKSLRISWSEQADTNGNHLREVKDLKNENQKSSFNETEHKTECKFGEASWRIFRRLPEDKFWLLCDEQVFLSIPLSSYAISVYERMTVDLTTITGSYNLGNFYFSISFSIRKKAMLTLLRRYILLLLYNL